MSVRTRGTPERLAAWLRRQREVAGADADNSELRLVHEGTQKLISKWRGAETRDDGVAEHVLQAAQDHCDGLQSMATYSLTFRVEADDELGNYTIRCKPADAAPTESADLSGLTAQLMRHNEATTRLVLTSVDRIMDGMSRLLEVTTTRLERAETQLQEIRAELEERDDVVDVSPAEPTAQDQIFELLKPHAPAILARLLGDGSETEKG